MSDDAPGGDPGSPPDPGAVPGSGDAEAPTALSESFLTIWLRPRATVRHIVARDPRYMVLAIAAVAGIPQLLSALPRSDAGLSLATMLLVGILAGPIFGIAGLYLASWLTGLAGRWFLHAQAPGPTLRTAIAWAALPHVISLPLWLLATAAFGEELFSGNADLLFRSPAYLLFALTNLALQLWSIYIASHGVAEVQAFSSAWKGFWNLLLGFLLVVAFTLVAGLALMLVLLLLGRVLA